MVDAFSLVIPRFHDVLGNMMARGHAHYWLYGGRASILFDKVDCAVFRKAMSEVGTIHGFTPTFAHEGAGPGVQGGAADSGRPVRDRHRPLLLRERRLYEDGHRGVGGQFGSDEEYMLV